ncbi:MAG: hypothetical protein OWS74_06925 [Firmicutes bacterium]|nr:hypothetical protein [Bacillota bacterium]
MAKPILIGLPTKDLLAPIVTMLELSQLSGRFSGRPVTFCIGQASNIPRARNIVMDRAREKSNEDPLGVLWIDADIVLKSGDSENLAQMIRWGEESGKAITANYRRSDGLSAHMADRTPYGARNYTEELKKGQNIGMAGFGCAYIPMPRNYRFRADIIGEDVYFWLDNPQLECVYAGFGVGHMKSIIV